MKKWRIQMKVQEASYLLDLEEIGDYKDEFINVISTQGTAYKLSSGKSSECGSARLIISEPSSDTRSVRGSFQDANTVWHLYDKPKYQAWNETELKSRTRKPAQELITESSLFRRANNNMIDFDVESDWPTINDIKEALTNKSEVRCFPDAVVARLGIAADSNYINSFPTVVEARLHIADMVNKASQIWEKTFNVSLRLEELITVGNSSNTSYSWDIPCDNNVNSIDAMNSRLQALTDWRRKARPNDGLATWSLLTNCPAGDVVGLAWQGTVCSSNGINTVKRNALDHKVLAHEIGHNFGAVHDCVTTSCGGSSVCCPLSIKTCDSNGTYIMSPGTSPLQSQFSPCTQSNICSGVFNGELNTRCLVGKSGIESSPLWESQCTSNLNKAELNLCIRNAQCSDYFKSNSSYYCGNGNNCRLTCFDPKTQDCKATELALLDGTPCDPQNPDYGSIDINTCVRGSCGSSRPSPRQRPGPRPGKIDHHWMWIGIGVGIGAAVLLTLSTIWMALKRSRDIRTLGVETGKLRPNEVYFPQGAKAGPSPDSHFKQRSQ